MVGSKLTMTLEQAAEHVGLTKRFFYRHWPELIKEGVVAYRVPKDSPKGRIYFRVDSLERYLEACQIKANFDVLNRPLGI